MADRPNILVVLCDQLTRRALSCYGDRNLNSVHIDRFATEGVRFSNACSTYPICVPFRFTMMTGLYAHHRRVPGIDYRMSPAEWTLADEFNAAGYHTAYIGKWHLYGGYGTWSMKKLVPRDHQGRWQKWMGFEFRNDFFDNVYFEDDDPTPRDLPGYQTDALFDRAIRYLTAERPTDRPFCAVLSVEAPHPPIEAPPELEAKWRAKDLALPPNFMTPPAEPIPGGLQPQSERAAIYRRRQVYYAMVEKLDHNMGRLHAALHDSGLGRNTVVLFLSDHGEMNGCHALLDKQNPFEESIGIPLIAWGPGCGIRPGQIDEPTCTEDLFPTLCGLADIRPRGELPGENLASLLTGQQQQLSRPGVMLEFVRENRPGMPFFGRPYRGFRSRRYKYTVLFEPNQGLRPWQFYDLEADPFELNNLIADPAAAPLIATHHGWLRDRMLATGDDEWLSPAWGYDAVNPWAVFHARG